MAWMQLECSICARKGERPSQFGTVETVTGQHPVLPVLCVPCLDKHPGIWDKVLEIYKYALRKKHDTYPNSQGGKYVLHIHGTPDALKVTQELHDDVAEWVAYHLVVDDPTAPYDVAEAIGRAIRRGATHVTFPTGTIDLQGRCIDLGDGCVAGPLNGVYYLIPGDVFSLKLETPQGFRTLNITVQSA